MNERIKNVEFARNSNYNTIKQRPFVFNLSTLVKLVLSRFNITNLKVLDQAKSSSIEATIIKGQLR